MMNNYYFRYLLLLLISMNVILIYSCFPHISTSTPPNINKEPLLYSSLQDIFSNKNDEILILPVWVTNPISYTNIGSYTYVKSFGKPIFIERGGLNNINKLIEGKINAFMLTIGAKMGRSVDFRGLYFISKSGHIVWLPGDSDRWFGYLDHSVLGDLWVQDLLNIFKENRDIKRTWSGFTWYETTEELWSRIIGGDSILRINNSYEEKDKIISFIEAISISKKSKLTDNWQREEFEKQK